MTLGPLIGYVPGVFDLFHVGHLNVLRQARELCDVLVAGVVSDEVCDSVKGIAPFVPLEERIAIVDAVGIVDATYAELTTDKVDAWHEVGFHRLFKGDDWKDSRARARARGAAGAVRRRGRLLPLHGAHLQHAPPRADRRGPARVSRRGRRVAASVSTTEASTCAPPATSRSCSPSTVATSGRSPRPATGTPTGAGSSSSGRPRCARSWTAGPASGSRTPRARGCSSTRT